MPFPALTKRSVSDVRWTRCMTFFELIIFYIGFWGMMILLTTSVDACNKLTNELWEHELTSQQGQACDYDPCHEPE